VSGFLDNLAQLPVTLHEIPAGVVFERICFISRRHLLTSYDAAYLDLAIETGLPLATLDDALIRACGSTGVELIGR
jgi:predicted nucleic acid-binding protein